MGSQIPVPPFACTSNALDSSDVRAQTQAEDFQRGALVQPGEGPGARVHARLLLLVWRTRAKIAACQSPSDHSDHLGEDTETQQKPAQSLLHLKEEAVKKTEKREMPRADVGTWVPRVWMEADRCWWTNCVLETQMKNPKYATLGQISEVAENLNGGLILGIRRGGRKIGRSTIFKKLS